MSAAMPVVAVTRGDLPGSGIDRLREVAQVRRWDSPTAPSPADLVTLCQDSTGLICQSTDRIDADFLSVCPSLKVVSTVGVGFDNIDTGALDAHHILGGNTPGVLTETTADLAFALILAAGRRLKEGLELTRSGKWKPGNINLLLGQDVHHATLGILGYGAIGQAVARRAHGFGMKVLQHSRTPKNHPLAQDVSLEQLLTQSDFVSIHVPLTDQSRGLIGHRELDLMKPTAVLVNTARGAVVDQSALIEALRLKKIFAAGLDVTIEEPTPVGDPLLSLVNCIVLPHIGSASLSTRAQMVDRAVDNVLAGLRGELLPYPINQTRAPV